MQELTFGDLLKRYRKLAGFKTLKQLADALADEGLIYSESLLSRWQKDSRLPKDRQVFLILIRLFVRRQAMGNIYEVNQLLSLAGMGFLSPDEVGSLLVGKNLELEMHLYDQSADSVVDGGLVRISLVLPRNLNRYLDWVSSQYKTSKAEVFRKMLDRQMPTIQ